MNPRRAVLVLAILALLPRPARGQTGLRDLLTDFLREGITLAPPPAGVVVSHEAHFIDPNSEQFIAVRQFNNELATQLATFPLASSAGGFAYQYDPTLGTFTRATQSFGPIYTERADTIGKGKFNVGINYSHFTFDRVDDLSLSRGDLKLVFTHQDVASYVKGDVITAELRVGGHCGRDRLRPDVRSCRRARHRRRDPDRARRHHGPDGRRRRAPGDAAEHHHPPVSGRLIAGDVRDERECQRPRRHPRPREVPVPSGKGRRRPGPRRRCPAPDGRGAGPARNRAPRWPGGFLIGSLQLGTFSPHINGGYTWSSNAPDPNAPLTVEASTIPNQVSYAAGFDWAIHPRVTFIVDVLGRTYLNSQTVTLVNQEYTAVTGDSIGGSCFCEPEGENPPRTIHRSFQRLSSSEANLNTLLGSIGFKVNPVGNLLITANVLFSLNRKGLQDSLSPLFAIDYSF